MTNLIFLTVYFTSSFLLFFRKSRFVLVLLVLLYLLLYDFIFLQLEDWLAIDITLSKTFLEVLLIFLLLAVTFKHIKKQTIGIFDIQVFAIFLSLSVIGIFISSVPLSEALKDLRILLLPMILSFLLVSVIQAKEIKFKLLINAYIFLAILIMAFGFYEFFTFDGDYTKTWRYEQLLELKLEQNPEQSPELVAHLLANQFIRNGELRVASIFISALDYSLFLGFFSIFIINYFFVRKNLLYLILFFLTVFALYTTNVRTGFIILILGLFLSYSLSSRVRLLYKFSFILPILTIAFSFMYIILGGFLNDASSIGRLDQYSYLFKNLSVLGSGLGSYTARFDSFYIYIFLTFGTATLLFLYFFYIVISRLARSYSQLKKPGSNPLARFFVKFSLVYILVMLYVFTFQHTAGSVNYFLFYLFPLISSVSIYKTQHQGKKLTSKYLELQSFGHQYE